MVNVPQIRMPHNDKAAGQKKLTSGQKKESTVSSRI